MKTLTGFDMDEARMQEARAHMSRARFRMEALMVLMQVEGDLLRAGNSIDQVREHDATIADLLQKGADVNTELVTHLRKKFDLSPVIGTEVPFELTEQVAKEACRDSLTALVGEEQADKFLEQVKAAAVKLTDELNDVEGTLTGIKLHGKKGGLPQ